ncbi:hypothetical protein FA13DRAFT_1734056, partial [Coprinellus micaceus]
MYDLSREHQHHSDRVGRTFFTKVTEAHSVDGSEAPDQCFGASKWNYVRDVSWTL